MLGRGDDVDYVPSLIYALTDPDSVVPRYAEQSLRLISRQVDVYKIPREGDVSDTHRAEAVQYWKKWFKSVRPEYIFAN